MTDAIDPVHAGVVILRAAPLHVSTGLLFPFLRLNDANGRHIATVVSNDGCRISIQFGQAVREFARDDVLVEICVTIIGKAAVACERT